MARARARYELTAQDRTQAAFASVNASMERTRTRMLRVGSAIAFIAGAAGLGRMVSASVQSANEIGKLSRQFGNTTQFLSEMRGILSLTGVEWSSFTTAIRTSSRAIDDAARGLATQKRAFDLLNIDIQQLQRLAPDQQFEAIVEGLRRMGPGFRQTAAAQAVFGRGGAELLRLANLQRGEFAKLRAEQRALGRSLSEDQTKAAEDVLDAFDRIKQSTQGVVDQFSLTLAPVVETVAGVFRTVLLPVVKFIALQFDRLTRLLGALGSAIKFLFQGEFAKAADAAKSAFDVVLSTIPENVDFFKNLLNPAAAKDPARKAGETIRNEIDKVFRVPTGTTLLDDELTKIRSFIGALRNVINLEDQRERGSSAVFDTSLQSLASGAQQRDSVLVQKLDRLEKTLAQRDLLRVMTEIRNILRSDGGQEAAVLG